MEFVESKDGEPLFSAVNVTNVCATQSGAALSWRILFGPYDLPWEVDTAILKLWFPKVDWLKDNNDGVGAELGLVDAASTATVWLRADRWGAGMLMKEYESELALVRRAQESEAVGASASAAVAVAVSAPASASTSSATGPIPASASASAAPTAPNLASAANPSSDVKAVAPNVSAPSALPSALPLNPVLEAEAAKAKKGRKGVRGAKGNAVKRAYRVMARNRRFARRGK
jgi:hypothetical protein